MRHYKPALESVVVNDGCMDNFDSDIATNLFVFFREDMHSAANQHYRNAPIEKRRP